MRLLFADQPVPVSLVAAWTTTEGQSKHQESVDKLCELHVWREQAMPGGRASILLHPTFRASLQAALCGGEMSNMGAVPAPGPDKHARDVEFLDKYARERWESVLHYMVGSPQASAGVSRDVVILLAQSGLISLPASQTTPVITPAGFQFLLMDTPSQIWYFILQYLDTTEERSMDLAECLQFLFQLSFCTVGKDYSSEGLTETQLKFMQHLRELGLVYQRKRKSQRYYSTRLAVNFASGTSSSPETSISPHERFLVVETNYRVYAYTDSPLQLALVALFCEMAYKLPGMAVGIITRESIGQALMNGITSKQIVSFLRTRAHSEMTKNTPIMPPGITDQIRLWELERDRLQFTDGVLYNQFLSHSDFQTLRDYAADLGVLLWANSVKRYIVVSRAGHDEVKRFWKRQKQLQ
jgi:transcription initiation factor TFIIH subunit 4